MKTVDFLSGRGSSPAAQRPVRRSPYPSTWRRDERSSYRVALPPTAARTDSALCAASRIDCGLNGFRDDRMHLLLWSEVLWEAIRVVPPGVWYSRRRRFISNYRRQNVRRRSAIRLGNARVPKPFTIPPDRARHETIDRQSPLRRALAAHQAAALRRMRSAWVEGHQCRPSQASNDPGAGHFRCDHEKRQ